MEHIKRSHPFRVTFCKVVIYCHYMHTVLSKCVKENRQGGHKCLTFTCRHLSDFTLVQDDTAKQLYIVVDHIPHSVVTSCNPVVMPNGFVSIDIYEITSFSCQLTVEVCSSNYDSFFTAFGKSASCVFYYRIHFRENYVQFFFKTVCNVLFRFVNLVENRLTLVDIRVFN